MMFFMAKAHRKGLIPYDVALKAVMDLPEPSTNSENAVTLSVPRGEHSYVVTFRKVIAAHNMPGTEPVRWAIVGEVEPEPETSGC